MRANAAAAVRALRASLEAADPRRRIGAAVGREHDVVVDIARGDGVVGEDGAPTYVTWSFALASSRAEHLATAHGVGVSIASGAIGRDDVHAAAAEVAALISPLTRACLRDAMAERVGAALREKLGWRNVLLHGLRDAAVVELAPHALPALAPLAWAPCRFGSQRRGAPRVDDARLPTVAVATSRPRAEAAAAAWDRAFAARRRFDSRPSRHDLALGVQLGYPPCCVDAYPAFHWSMFPDPYGWSRHFASTARPRAGGFEFVHPWANYAGADVCGFDMLVHRPCGPRCEATVSRAARFFADVLTDDERALLRADMGVSWVVWRDGTLAPLRVASADPRAGTARVDAAGDEAAPRFATPEAAAKAALGARRLPGTPFTLRLVPGRGRLAPERWVVDADNGAGELPGPRWPTPAVIIVDPAGSDPA